MEKQNKTVIIMCGDWRLRARDKELFRFYTKLDGSKPFRALLPGGCLPFQNDEIMKLALLPYFMKGANHIHLEDHMGTNDVPGCAAYGVKHSQQHGSNALYSCRVEEIDHINQLEQVSSQLAFFAERNGHETTINYGIYRHDAVGRGSLDLIQAERDVPSDVGRGVVVHHQVARR